VGPVRVGAACAIAIIIVLVAGCGEAAQPGSGATGTEAPASPIAESVAPSSSAPASARQSDSPAASAAPVGNAELSIDWTVPFTVTAPADWTAGEAVTDTGMEVVDGTGLRAVLVLMLKTPDSPETWVDRLTTNEAIDATEPEPVDVGGASGFAFDASVNDTAADCVVGGSNLGGRCVVVHGPVDDWAWVLTPGRPARLWVLDVDGETVVLMSDAREDRFDTWKATIEQVVATLEWR
jgi:hypothetical protein